MIIVDVADNWFDYSSVSLMQIKNPNIGSVAKLDLFTIIYFDKHDKRKHIY